MTYKCADSPEGYGAFLRLFVCVLLLGVFFWGGGGVVGGGGGFIYV